MGMYGKKSIYYYFFIILIFFITITYGFILNRTDIDKIENDNLFKKNDYKSFTKEYISKAYQLLYLSVNTSKEVIKVISSKLL